MTMVYIAGPMTGIEDCNRPAFHRLAGELNEQGHNVLNPATLPDGLTQAQYMDICLAMLRCADIIYMLPGWVGSNGARAEHSLAIKLNIRVVYC